MNQRLNEFGQPIGAALPAWTPRPLPPATPMLGRTCRLERLDRARHAAGLWDAFCEAPDARDWTYLPEGPFPGFLEFDAYLAKLAAQTDPLAFAVIDARNDKPVGYAAFLRIDPTNGVMEVGAVNYSPRLKRTPAGTEAMYLMMRRAFDELGYRRYEWKCDSLNKPSWRAAERYGFTFEGVFRQLIVRKGRNRDTAWFSMLDTEWPRIRAAFEAWLAPENFTADGSQRRSLSALRA